MGLSPRSHGIDWQVNQLPKQDFSRVSSVKELWQKTISNTKKWQKTCFIQKILITIALHQVSFHMKFNSSSMNIVYGDNYFEFENKKLLLREIIWNFNGCQQVDIQHRLKSFPPWENRKFAWNGWSVYKNWICEGHTFWHSFHHLSDSDHSV